MDRTYILLKPMATGAGGFARLERHADRTLIQWQGKGLRVRAARVFACDGAGAARELGVCAVDAHGQASLMAELSSRQGAARVEAILALSDEAAPKPLLLGVRQSGAGALLEARSAMLSLCARLSGGMARGDGGARAPQPVAHTGEESAARGGDSPAGSGARSEVRVQAEHSVLPMEFPDAPQSAAAPPSAPASAAPMAPALLPPPARFAEELTPEVFLPAIDPTVYVPAMQPQPDDEWMQAARVVARERERGAGVIARDASLLAPPRFPPLDRPRPLRWPPALRGLAAYFDAGKPFAPFDAPGWRFVRVPMGDGFFAVGRRCRDGEVREVLYAEPGTRGEPPPRGLRGYRHVKAPDGQGYWVCRQAMGE